MNLNNSFGKRQAYTGARPDILSRVPTDALRILDAGCSNGTLGAALRAMQADRIVEGIEFDAGFCQEAAAKLDRVIQADLNHFDWQTNFAGTTFDCMIFADVLEHLADPWRTLSQAMEHLETGGCAIISVPNIRHISSLNSIFLRGTFPRIDRGLFDRTHLRWFTSMDARRLLETSGLEVTSLSANLRINDIPNTPLNKFAENYLTSYKKWSWVREFFGYQILLVGRKV